MKYSQLLKMIHEIDKKNFQKMPIAVISNMVLEPYFKPLMVQAFSKSNIEPLIDYIPYEICQGEQYTDILSNAQIIIVWLNFELLYPDVLNKICCKVLNENTLLCDTVQLWNMLLKQIKSSALRICFGFEDFYRKDNVIFGNIPVLHSLIDKMNSELCTDMDEDTVFIDLKRLIADIGTKNAYDTKGKYRWSSPYNQQLTEEAVNEIYKQYLIYKGITKKCIVLDCDNVLWGGILSEDGIENIDLNPAYKGFQNYLIGLYYHGVILAICSKNDYEDVLTVFHKHSEMALKEEYISCFQVNWDNKADNIKKISVSLNIGLDSIVFIDDSYFEIEAVKHSLPDVTAILYEPDTIYEQLSCFNLKSVNNIENIQLRNNTYRTNQLRENLKTQYLDYQEYLLALKMKIEIKEAVLTDYKRISELSQRANKCTNGKRYTVADINERTASGSYMLYSVTLSDKFSDLGLVGTIGIEKDSLDLFCLSCRALGRDVENQMIQTIKKWSIHKMEFISTGKNSGLERLLKSKLCL